MATIVNEVLQFWQNNVTLTNLFPVDAAPNGKVWYGLTADKVPQPPYVVLSLDTTKTYRVTNQADFIEEGRLGVGVYASNELLAEQYSDQIFDVLDGCQFTSRYMTTYKLGDERKAEPGGAYKITYFYKVSVNRP